VNLGFYLWLLSDDMQNCIYTTFPQPPDFAKGKSKFWGYLREFFFSKLVSHSKVHFPHSKPATCSLQIISRKWELSWIFAHLKQGLHNVLGCRTLTNMMVLVRRIAVHWFWLLEVLVWRLWSWSMPMRLNYLLQHFRSLHSLWQKSIASLLAFISEASFGVLTM